MTRLHEDKQVSLKVINTTADEVQYLELAGICSLFANTLNSKGIFCAANFSDIQSLINSTADKVIEKLQNTPIKF